MATRSTFPVEEYLRMSFDGPACEYLDGELVERHLGEKPHSLAQGNLVVIFHELKKKLALWAYPELDLRTGPRRYRIADLAVFAEEPAENIPSTPPLITIEIISSADRYSEIRDKCEEYRHWGVKHVWLVDPQSRKLSVYDDTGLHDVPGWQLSELGVEIAPAQIFD